MLCDNKCIQYISFVEQTIKISSVSYIDIFSNFYQKFYSSNVLLKDTHQTDSLKHSN